MFSYIQPLLFLCPSGSRSVSKHDFFWSPARTRWLFQAARAQSRGPGAHSDQQRIRYCRCVLCRSAPQECAGFPRVHAPCVVCVWPAALHSPAGDHLIQCEQLPDVCQTIEVTTENEEQTVSSSHSYPLQISPVSSCCGETPHTQTHPLNRSMLRGTTKKSPNNAPTGSWPHGNLFYIIVVSIQRIGFPQLYLIGCLCSAWAIKNPPWFRC